MRKEKVFFICLIILLCVTTLSFAEVTWVAEKDATIEWTAAEKLAPTDILEYVVFLANAITDPNKVAPIKTATTSGTEHTFILVTEGKYYAGVQTVLRLEDGSHAGESGIVWSDNPVDVRDGITFGISHYMPRPKPKGLGCLGL